MRPADIPAGGFISCDDVSKYSDESAGNETITRDVERHEVLIIDHEANYYLATRSVKPSKWMTNTLCS